MTKRTQLLPLEPIGLRLPTAAAFLGVSTSKFQSLVEQGRLPKPKSVDRVRVWDRRALTEAFDLLSSDDEGTGWEDVS